MSISRRQFAVRSVAALAAAPALPALARPARPAKIRVLIVDGINNHDWKTATHGITEILTRTGLFTIDVSTTPPRDAPPSAWDTWRPAFSKYDVVINNFNGGDSLKGIQWPAPVEASLEAYVTAGGGLVSYHAGNNAFTPWPAYNQMIGLGWRPAAFGTGIAIADDDTVIYIPKGQGHAPGHPANLDFQLRVRDTRHSITAGMPPLWMHPFEQLTHGQHGPAEGLTILTCAHSPVTSQNEPMDWSAIRLRPRLHHHARPHLGRRPLPQPRLHWLPNPARARSPVGRHRPRHHPHPASLSRPAQDVPQPAHLKPRAAWS